MFAIKQEAKSQSNEFVVWPTEQNSNMDTDKGFAANKPLMSILDLGKLLLQYSKDGDATKVHELITKGAPFNADWLGMTPLHYAAKRNSYVICDMLLRGGINKDAKTKVDRTALHFAVYEGNKEIVELLLSRNAEINIKDMLRMTALHWAIEKRHKVIVRMLIKHGADVSALSKFDKTPMAIAIQTGQVDLLDELEAARHNQRNKILMEAHENQTETNEAVNSITIINTQKEDDEMSCKNDNQSHATNKLTNSSIRNNTTHNDDDEEEVDYVEPIVNLMDDTKQMDESALEMLKTHGITMLPTDDPQNLLTTALEGGRKLVLSEAGKLVLKNTNHSLNSKLPSAGGNILRKLSQSQINNLNKNNNRKAPYIVKAKPESPFKSNKNVKIITMDMFKQMYGGELGNRLKKVVKPNLSGTTSPTKVTKLIKLSNVTNKKPPIVQKISIEEFRNQTQTTSDNGKCSENDELPPNIIEVCSESEDDTIEESITRSQIKINTLQSSSFPLSKPILAVAPQVHNDVPNMELLEICRQVHDLRKQMEDLRRQLEQTQKQNDEYRRRLEKLERDREVYS